MARLIALLLTSLAIVGCSGKWTDFESKEGKFSTQFPAKPKHESKNQPTALGSMTLHFFSVERRDGLFGVGYLDFPDLIMVRAREDPEALKAMLEEVLEGVIRRTGLQLDAPSRQIFMRNNPGREASAAGRIQNKDAVMKVRIYLVENRLYQIMTVGEKNGLKEKDVDLFFYSFRLL